MEAHLMPIRVALITFPLVAIFFTLPFVIYQYRKFAYVNKFKALILYSFLLYLMVAYYLVILPLPVERDILSMQRPGTVHYNLVPFRSIKSIVDESNVVLGDPATYRLLFTERAFLQVVFNAILLTPLGIYLRYYFKRSLKQTLILSFSVSLFFEISQLTGLFWIYNAPYRLFDVDDLFLNTLGGYIGYLISPVFTFFLPKKEDLDKEVSPSAQSVGYFRRFIAYSIDLFLIGLLPHTSENLFIEAAAYFLYFIVLVYGTNGLTVGKWLTRTRVKGRGERLLFKEVFVRYGILYLGVFSGGRFIREIISANQSTDIGYAMILLTLGHALAALLLAGHFILCIIRKSGFFYEKASGTRIESDNIRMKKSF